MILLLSKLSPARKIIIALAVLWLAQAAACNYPRSVQAPPTRSSGSLELTLSAMDRATSATAGSSPTAAPAGRIDPFPGLHTATPAGMSPLPTATPGTGALPEVFQYHAQSGDTLTALVLRFEVEPAQIISNDPIPKTGYLPPGQVLLLPRTLPPAPYPDALLPDSEVIHSPSAVGFGIDAYVRDAGGFLASYEEAVNSKILTGAEIIERVAVERAVNPRLLLAFLEYRSGWLRGQPSDPSQIAHPIGFYVPGQSGLYKELTLAANHLNIAYYAWRIGKITQLWFRDGRPARLNPALNAGSVAVQNLFSKFYDREPWTEALYGPQNFIQLHEQLFGNAWARAAEIEPLLHPGVIQTELELPFAAGERWSFTGGPHKILNLGSPLGALDFGPTIGAGDCAVSPLWVRASAPGIVTRSDQGIVALDLDFDGYEQTGWVLFYLHIAAAGRVPAGASLDTDDPIGHPSCEGGNATGTHVHIARKYQGEWIAADGPIPFVLSGWVASAGERAYMGWLSRGGHVVQANPGGSGNSLIER